MAGLHDGPAASLSLGLQTRHGDSRRTLALTVLTLRRRSLIPWIGTMAFSEGAAAILSIERVKVAASLAMFEIVHVKDDAGVPDSVRLLPSWYCVLIE
jgi:hypothetical protein